MCSPVWTVSVGTWCKGHIQPVLNPFPGRWKAINVRGFGEGTGLTWPLRTMLVGTRTKA